MSEGIFTEPDGATPLSPEEQQGLRPSWITTRADLNEAEADNVLKGLAWSRRRRATAVDVATDRFSRELHKRMFGNVWAWAGTYRATERNLGVPPWRIGNDCAVLFDQFQYWIEHSTFSRDELGVRFHHQIVSIHPFANGNGRHSRLMGDLLVEKLGGSPFAWGSGDLQTTSDLRRRYIHSLREADGGDVTALLAFARS